MFCALNGYQLEVDPDEAVEMVVAVAAGELAETAVATWLAARMLAL